MNTSRIFASVTVAGALFLTACSGESTTETVTVTQSSEATTTSSSTATTSSAAASSNAGGDKASVAAAVETALAHKDGKVISIDREDQTDVYEITIVAGEETYELNVNGDTVTEKEIERDEDDVRAAQEATVDVLDALDEALAAHPDALLDNIELDRENGQLRWEVDLEDANGVGIADIVVNSQ